MDLFDCRHAEMVSPVTLALSPCRHQLWICFQYWSLQLHNTMHRAQHNYALTRKANGITTILGDNSAMMRAWEKARGMQQEFVILRRVARSS